MPSQQILITCEHGGFKIPSEYKLLFRNAKAVLRSHRGWDQGALVCARELNRILKARVIFSEVSRLLVDLNRSPNHRHAFSEYTQSLSVQDRAQVLRKFHTPYRQSVRRAILGKRILHLSVHSFTPIFNRRVRSTDVGILYDPRRESELKVSVQLQRALRKAFPSLRVHRNLPYRGWADGLTTTLRRERSATQYCGIELEINQDLISRIDFKKLAHAISASRDWS